VKHRRAAALALLALLALVSCGRKGPVKPPELARPEPIGDLQAVNEREDIVLSWGRPTRYADRTRMADLGEFRLERSSGDDPAFTTIAVLPVTDRERFRQIKRFRFADRGVTEGVNYRYRVVSATVDGYASSPSNMIAIVREVPAPPTPTPVAEKKEEQR
jgi:predicted small lipoprotein YifL